MTVTPVMGRVLLQSTVNPTTDSGQHDLQFGNADHAPYGQKDGNTDQSTQSDFEEQLWSVRQLEQKAVGPNAMTDERGREPAGDRHDHRDAHNISQTRGDLITP